MYNAHTTLENCKLKNDNNQAVVQGAVISFLKDELVW